MKRRAARDPALQFLQTELHAFGLHERPQRGFAGTALYDALDREMVGWSRLTCPNEPLPNLSFRGVAIIRAKRPGWSVAWDWTEAGHHGAGAA